MLPTSFWLGGAGRNLKKRIKRAKSPSRERFSTVRLFCHGSPSSLDRRQIRMHPATNRAIMKDDTETEIRVDMFEIVKLNSNSAMKNITILSVVQEGQVNP
jgi:hypothetical protein